MITKLKNLVPKFKKPKGKGANAKPKAADTTPVTEENLEKQKREILTRARAFIQPLVPSKHRAFFITAVIVLGFMVVFLAVFAALIYKFEDDSNLVYRVSRIIPYPVAKVDGSYVPYGDYLFELRPLKHFYANPTGPAASSQQPIDFNTEEGKKQLDQLRQAAFNELKKKVVTRQLAEKHGVKVTRQELNEALNEQISRQGGETKFNETIQSYYGWSIDDFRRALADQLLRSKLQPILSTEQRALADRVLDRIKGGADFGRMARTHSADSGSREKGGDLGFAPKGTYVAESEKAAYALEVGQVSDIIPSQFGFHIIKVIAKEDERIHVAHILISYDDFNQLIAEDLSKARVKTFITIPDPQTPEQQPT